MNQRQGSAYLEGLSQEVEGKRFTLEGDEVLIGRGTKCQIKLSDPKVSRQHARIRFDGGGIIVDDLKSSHGTLVNGQKVLSAELQAGDELTLGDTRLRFYPLPDAIATVMAGEEAPAAAASESPIQTMSCRHCGEQVEVDKRFCPYCGQPLQTPVAQPSPVVVPMPQPMAVPPPALPASAIAEERGRRGWVPFLLGLAVPLLLAGLVVFALVMLGVFEEPETLPDLGLEPSADIASGDEENPGIEASLPFGFRAYNPEMDINLPRQANLTEYLDPAAEERSYQSVIDLPEGQDLVLEIFFCGKSDELLADVDSASSVKFSIGQAVFSEESMYAEVAQTDTRACNVYRGVLYDMAPGEYLMVQTISVTEPIYDGWETWGPDELAVATLIRISGEASQTEGDGGGAGETDPPSERLITLHEGDARMFTQPPAVIAYANTQVQETPPEFSISEGCGVDCLRYYEWLGLPEANQWLEASATISTTTIGVQLWSDTTGGYGRVYLDGEEIWSGDTRGEDNQWPGGAFVRYLEISGLADTTHSLRVEALGEGGPVTVYFFGLGPVIP